MLKKAILASALALLLAGCGRPPGKERVQEALKRYIPVPFEVLQVRQLPEIPGLCEVVLRVDRQPIVLYLDRKAQYVVSGNLMSLESKKNLTLETQNKFLQK